MGSSAPVHDKSVPEFEGNAKPSSGISVSLLCIMPGRLTREHPLRLKKWTGGEIRPSFPRAKGLGPPTCPNLDFFAKGLDDVFARPYPTKLDDRPTVTRSQCME